MERYNKSQFPEILEKYENIFPKSSWGYLVEYLSNPQIPFFNAPLVFLSSENKHVNGLKFLSLSKEITGGYAVEIRGSNVGGVDYQTPLSKSPHVLAFVTKAPVGNIYYIENIWNHWGVSVSPYARGLGLGSFLYDLKVAIEGQPSEEVCPGNKTDLLAFYLSRGYKPCGVRLLNSGYFEVDDSAAAQIEQAVGSGMQNEHLIDGVIIYLKLYDDIKP